MSAAILQAALGLAQAMLGVAMGLCVYRAIRGPRAQDRIIALDACYAAGLLMLITLGIRMGSTRYFEAGVIIALLGFASTVAFAKFLMRGEVIE